jgi:hypothetical protein
MATIIDDLKAQARILQRRAIAADRASLARLSAANVRERPIQRRHCLTAIARELGFAGWPHAVAVLRGRRVRDFGTLLYPSECAAHFNIWCAGYDEARSIRAEHGGYLLAYRHQFFIVDSHFIESLGLDPSDPDWERIGRDWVEPKDRDARSRLYHKLVRRRQAPLASAT